ncbi:trehalose-6-phosphate synthase, partial [Anaerotruncus massiliensis (ex Liu et al. 2021)]|uniref:trehalose-6-phosphate synthase n=1 Tax=Anaerotruncus massiliensis (ex Liu et al. 2021) TaxID=2321404 RepID=UPI003AB6A637
MEGICPSRGNFQGLPGICDKVWIQDYQLMLLPGMLRKVYPDLNIGYFHHIPFPSYELF